MCDADQPPVPDKTQRLHRRLGAVEWAIDPRIAAGGVLVLRSSLMLATATTPRLPAAQPAVGVEFHAGEATREMGLCDSALGSASGLRFAALGNSD